jgi:hypothetical protein
VLYVLSLCHSVSVCFSLFVFLWTCIHSPLHPSLSLSLSYPSLFLPFTSHKPSRRIIICTLYSHFFYSFRHILSPPPYSSLLYSASAVVHSGESAPDSTVFEKYVVAPRMFKALVGESQCACFVCTLVLVLIYSFNFTHRPSISSNLIVSLILSCLSLFFSHPLFASLPLTIYPPSLPLPSLQARATENSHPQDSRTPLSTTCTSWTS